MESLVLLIQRLLSLFCRHEWIRDRGPDGELLLWCMKCCKSKRHELARLVAWKPCYTPIEPIALPDLPPPLQLPAMKKRHAA